MDRADYSIMLQQDSGSDATDANQESESVDELQDLHQRIQEAKVAVQKSEEELEMKRNFWSRREQDLLARVEEKSQEVCKMEDKLFIVEHHFRHGNPPPPGPKSLRFVEEAAFTTLCASVVGVNLVTMTREVLHPDSGVNFIMLDSVFLVFYIVEMFMRMTYHQREFFIGHSRVVGWNWLDMALVLTGMAGVWIYPLFFSGEEGPAYTSALRVLRMMRFARAFKICKVVCTEDMSWTEGMKFQSFMMAVISFNAILMGMEIEYPDIGFVWFYLEQLLLVIFAFELTVRLKGVGVRDFFCKEQEWAWNWLDFLIVAGGVIDQWVLPAMSFVHSLMEGDKILHQDEDFTQAMRLLRMARLLRILRLVRLVRNVQPLYTLVVGVYKAMQGMSWVMLLTISVLYIGALLGVKLVGPDGILLSGCALDGLGDNETDTGEALEGRRLHGHGGSGGHHSDELAKVAMVFPNMFDAMFNLFKVMQCDMESMEPMFAWAPVTKYVMMLFVVLTNWAIFSILTAVVSDEMAKVTTELEEAVSEDEKKQKNTQLVEKIFTKYAAVSGRPNELSKVDFEKLLGNRNEAEELCMAADLEPDDLQEFFDILSRKYENDRDLKIHKNDFLEGLEKERVAVNQRSMMKLEKRLNDMDAKIHDGMLNLEAQIERAITTGPLAQRRR